MDIFHAFTHLIPMLPICLVSFIFIGRLDFAEDMPAVDIR
jgi:hypothetical protein